MSGIFNINEAEPLQDNEIIFQLPKAFNVGNAVVITGKLNQNNDRLRIGLIMETGNSRKNLFSIILNFVTDEISFFSNDSLVKDQEIPELSSLFPDPDFVYYIKFLDSSQNELLLGITLGGYTFDSIKVQTTTEILNNHQNIFLSVQDDTLKMEELKFIW